VELLRAGRDAAVEYRVLLADGRQHHLHARCRGRPRPGGGTLVSGIVSDVSAGHDARAELAEARAALDRVVSGIDEVLYTLELTPGDEPRLTYLGPGWERLVGRAVTPEEADAWLAPLIHPDDMPAVRQANARAADGEPVDVVYRVIGSEGRERHVLDRVRPRPDTRDPVVADGIVIDVTERMRAETALRESEARLRRVTRAAPVVLFEIDAAGILRFSDGRGLEALGGRTRLRLGRSVFELYGADSDVGRSVQEALTGVPVAATLQLGEVAFDARFEPQFDASGAVTGLVGVALDVTPRVQAERAAAELAAEQGALRRVATAVAHELDPAELFHLVADETCRLLGGDGAVVSRLRVEGDVVVVGSANGEGMPPIRPGTRIPRIEGGLVASVGGGVAPVGRRGLGPEEDGMAPVFQPYRSAVAAPVTVGGERWGVLIVGSTDPVGIPPGAEERLVRFADLVGTAIANAEARDRLAAQALTDPLTGCLNHRGFHDRFAEELQRARRRGSDLSLVLMDVDHFKLVNDAAGHQTGDRVLAALAERISPAVRAGESLGRLGGDEFALLLPDVGPAEAIEAAERLRELIVSAPLDGYPVTVSLGVCDLARAGDDADALYRLADGALYWAKGHGRNAAWLYSPDVVRELSAEERAERLTRAHALAGIRALARAIDAKDPSTADHAERVADVAADVAEALGWDGTSVTRLRDAARVHDVGKIGVPDSVLLKPGPLTAAETELMRQHAELGAQIAEEVLDVDQVSWIRAHHERPDGTGYPRGLRGDAIPQGAAILALADAWDVMTSDRPYRSGMATDDAVAELRRCVGTQFTPDVVVAFLRSVGQGMPTP
ncbi:MAG: hypothetical protein AVDCRST_MAG79-2936, partial [uncultured Thermoleophilia bacterium]